MEEIERLLEENEQPQRRWTAASLSEVAAFFGLSTQTVKAWRTENPACPGSDPDGWPLDAITRWRHAKLTNSDVNTAQKEATLESTQLANDAKRLELAKERGELLERAAVELWASQAIITFRETLMALSENLATSCPHELRSVVRAETDLTVRAALATMQRNLEMAELDKQVSGDVAASDELMQKGSDHAEH